jgi:hypothetical protein
MTTFLSLRMAARRAETSTRDGCAIAPTEGTVTVAASMPSRSSGGSTARIFATTFSAAAARRASPRNATQREPSTSASISSAENMSGGSVKPGRRT